MLRFIKVPSKGYLKSYRGDAFLLKPVGMTLLRTLMKTSCPSLGWRLIILWTPKSSTMATHSTTFEEFKRLVE
jgi:hypothetical protein